MFEINFTCIGFKKQLEIYCFYACYYVFGKQLHIIYWINLFVRHIRYDGQRAQIHKLSNGTFRIFSRNGDDTTSRFPDLISIIKDFCKPAAATFILDTEVSLSLRGAFQYLNSVISSTFCILGSCN